MKAGDVRKGVGKLTDVKPRRSGDDIWTIDCPHCRRQVGWTKMSRKPANTQLGKRLESLIPVQLGITKDLFDAIVGCTKGQPEYLAAVGHGH